MGSAMKKPVNDLVDGLSNIFPKETVDNITIPEEDISKSVNVLHKLKNEDSL